MFSPDLDQDYLWMGNRVSQPTFSHQRCKRGVYLNTTYSINVCIYIYIHIIICSKDIYIYVLYYMYNICIRRCKYTYMFIYLPNSEHSIKQPGCKGLEQQQKGPKRISGTWTCALWKGNSDTNHMFSHLISNLSRMYVPSDLRSIPSLGPPYQHRILVHFRNFLPERVWVTFHPELHRWMLHGIKVVLKIVFGYVFRK